ncbi:hypothetical protein [Paenarthrobacter sp. TA1.8]|uniref:hypothetical protein n=1 Tax=Paenarthrobacter sp. TA1.8 TaxID=3400219 RepID=UPI003B4340D0
MASKSIWPKSLAAVVIVVPGSGALDGWLGGGCGLSGVVVLVLGGGVKSGASLEVLLAQDDATSARTTAAAARSPGLDTLCSYRQERAPRPGLRGW